MSKRSVLITGCSSGIGRALTEEFLRQGFLVYAGVRALDSLNDLSDDNLRPLELDVTNDSHIQACIERIQQETGELNYLINNAGYAAMGPIVDLSSDDIQRQFSTNVFAPMALCKAALPLLRAAKKQALIVNIGSISGITTTPFSGVYCATKAALHSLSDALRMELAPFGIKVITVQPGAIQSKFGDNSMSNLAPVLSDDSIYAPIKHAIEARAVASQENPTPASEFAKELIAQLLSQPDSVIRIGHGSKLLPLLKRWLPGDWLDTILSKKFALNSLND